MGVCLARQSVAVADPAPTASTSAMHTALPLSLLKETPCASLTAELPSFSSDMPFSNYDYHVWSNLQQQDKQSMHDRVNGMLHEQRSFSIAILQRISIERLSLSTEKVSLLDDLQLTNKDDEVRSAQGAAGKGTRIGNRGRQLSSTLNNIYSQLNDVAPPHEDEAKEDYLKRIFSIVDSQGMGKVSSMQLTNSLFNDANRASTTVMMTAADHDKDGYLSESEFVSFLINTESGGDCLQADRNEPKPTQSNPTSTRNDAICDALGSLSAQQTAQKDAHRLTALNDLHMHGIEVTNLCSQSSRIKCIALSPDGKLYAVAHRHDSVAHVYMISNGAEVRRLVGHQGPLLSIIFSPDRKHVMTAARDNFMVSWDHTVGLECSFSEHPGIVTAVAVSCDSQFVFSGCQDNLVRRITASKAKIRAVLPHIPCKTPGVIVALATQSTKNDVVAFSRSCDQCAYIANAKDLQLVAQLTGHESLVWKASFNADDSMLLTCCERKIIVWDGTYFSSVRIFSSVVVATPGSADEVLWTTAVFASQEHCNLLFCFNSVGQMHVLDCDAVEMEESIIDIQMRSSVYTTSIFVGDTMVCGDNYGNVYRVRIT